MKKQENMAKTKKRSPEKYHTEMEAYKLSDKQFKIIIIMMFYICKEMKYEQNDTVNKKTENIKNK